MIAALRSEFGPLPDQSMHEKTSVPALIEEIYTFLRQADARELGGLFRDLDAARAEGDELKAKPIQASIDNPETHVVPILADIDASSAERRAGKECVSTFQYRWSPFHSKNKYINEISTHDTN